MTGDEDWTWKFTPRAADQFDSLDPQVQDRIVSKLDEVLESEWREPDEFLEPVDLRGENRSEVGVRRPACPSPHGDRTGTSAEGSTVRVSLFPHAVGCPPSSGFVPASLP